MLYHAFKHRDSRRSDRESLLTGEPFCKPRLILYSLYASASSGDMPKRFPPSHTGGMLLCRATKGRLCLGSIFWKQRTACRMIAGRSGFSWCRDKRCDTSFLSKFFEQTFLTRIKKFCYDSTEQKFCKVMGVARDILHIDFNNFYASVECLDHPELDNVPVVVGGNEEARHGIVLSKNELAKRNTA